MEVQEFRVVPDITSDRSRDRRIRLVLWGSILALVGIAFVGIVGARSFNKQVDAVLAFSSVAIVVCAVGGAYLIALRMGIERVRLASVFLLTDRELVYRRSEWPDVRIGMSEVERVYEPREVLVVESIEPRRRIVIPKSVRGFTNLRTELLKHSAITEAPRSSPLLFILAVANYLCWAMVLLSRKVTIVGVAGLLVLSSQAWYCLRIGRNVRGHRKRLLLWAVLIALWGIALGLVIVGLSRTL
jgi:hypothetical protein